MKFLDFFAGIGGFHSGLELAGHECVGWVEWDKYARTSYEALYDTKGLYTEHDITVVKTEKLPKADIWCFGSPCTNISLAGNKKGLRGEQSGLFFEVMRILNETPEERKPAYLFMENVKNLISINGGRDFAKVLIEMDEAGYDVEWQVINSSWVIPQNRERIFVVGHKRGRQTRRVFPLTSEEIGTERKYGILKDVLEPVVDEKYNLSEEKLKKIKYLEKDLDTVFNSKTKTLPKIRRIFDAKKYGLFGQTHEVIDENGVTRTLTASDYKHPIYIATKIEKVFDGRRYGLFGQVNEILGENGLSTTLTTMEGGGRVPKVLIKNATNLGYSIATDGDGIDFSYPDSKSRRGRVQKDRSHTLVTGMDLGVAVKNTCNSLLIRRLTPRECWRLQGFTDEQFDKVKNAGLSDTQLYKQAGNAVTVPVIKKIAEKFTEI